jgi:hypothetical protein
MMYLFVVLCAVCLWGCQFCVRLGSGKAGVFLPVWSAQYAWHGSGLVGVGNSR